jgi:Mor family transcriptional regulator
MQEQIGISEQMAQPFVDSVMRCFAGERLYFPVKIANYPIEEIRGALRGGASTAQITRRYRLSRTTLYKLFPGGLRRQVRSAGEN